MVISPIDWCYLENRNKSAIYVITPGPHFARLLHNREYINAIDKSPELFGTGNAMDVIEAIRRTENSLHPELDSMPKYDESYLRHENMAYIFEVKGGVVTDKVLRLDLYRKIDEKGFTGGIFHAFKHFTIEGYETLSNVEKGEFEMRNIEHIITVITLNFFSDEFSQEENSHRDCYYVAHSQLAEGHSVRGVYYKVEGIPVYFLNSFYVSKK